MNPRQHAFLARALQDACGGVDACLNLLEETPYKMGRTHMYDCREPGSGRTMPIGAVLFLELAGRQQIYTPAICAAAPPPSDAECASSEAAEATEAMAQAQRLIRLAGQDKVYTEHERREIEPVLQRVEAHVRGARAAMDGAST